MSTQQSIGLGQEPEGLSTPQLETELLGLAGHLAAAQCRFLQLLAEFDRRNGWAGPGLRSCAHWLSWRIGMNLRTAREHLRVAHALVELPAITAAFAAGKLSYSKVRAITRVTSPASGCLDPEDAEQTPAEQTLAEQTPPEQPLAPDDTAPGPIDPAAREIPTASDAPAAATEAPDPPRADIPPASTTAPNLLAPDAEETLLQLALAGTASHVETVVRATRRRQADPQRAAALRTLTWRWDEDGSLIIRGRLAPAEGAALIAAIEAEVPPRRAAGHPPSEPPAGWRESAVEQEPGAVSDLVGARRADALVRLVSSGGASGPEVSRGQVRVIMHIGGTATGAEIEGGPEIPHSTAERLSCDADAQLLLEDPLSPRLYFGRSRRFASPAQIAALTVRDGGTCQFPGCTHTRYLHAHHVIHWLHGGRTDLDNLALICSFHHVLIHERGFRMRSHGSGWAFLRPDGTPVPPTTAPLVGKVESLIQIHTRAELAITRNSLTPTWAGERLDPEPILDRLLPRPVPAAA